VLWIAAILAAFASFELAAFQHAAATGLSAAQALSPWHQWDALQFRFGRIAAARAVLLAMSAVLTARLAREGTRATRPVVWCTTTTAVGLGLAETLVLLGHSSAAGPLASGARLLHVVGVSIWIGGLVMLLCVVVPRRRVDELLVVLPRFSALATGAVVILTAGGVLLAVDLVGTAGALPSTGYGRVLLAKLAVVGALLYAAARSRRHVRACLQGPDQLGATAVVRPLAVWVGTEVGLVAVVLGLTALLVTRIPPG
jgi:putative copper export protein